MAQKGNTNRKHGGKHSQNMRKTGLQGAFSSDSAKSLSLWSSMMSIVMIIGTLILLVQVLKERFDIWVLLLALPSSAAWIISTIGAYKIQEINKPDQVDVGSKLFVVLPAYFAVGYLIVGLAVCVMYIKAMVDYGFEAFYVILILIAAAVGTVLAWSFYRVVRYVLFVTGRLLGQRGEYRTAPTKSMLAFGIVVDSLCTISVIALMALNAISIGAVLLMFTISQILLMYFIALYGFLKATYEMLPKEK